MISTSIHVCEQPRANHVIVQNGNESAKVTIDMSQTPRANYKVLLLFPDPSRARFERFAIYLSLGWQWICGIDGRASQSDGP
jgi:hypothetical protein